MNQGRIIEGKEKRSFVGGVLWCGKEGRRFVSGTFLSWAHNLSLLQPTLPPSVIHAVASKPFVVLSSVSPSRRAAPAHPLPRFERR